MEFKILLESYLILYRDFKYLTTYFFVSVYYLSINYFFKGEKMKKYKIFFIGKQEHVHTDIAQWGHILMKEFEAEGFHLETEVLKFIQEKGWKGVSVRHLNGATSSFSIGTDPDEKGFKEEDFFVINAYDENGNLLNADKKDEFFRL